MSIKSGEHTPARFSNIYPRRLTIVYTSITGYSIAYTFCVTPVLTFPFSRLHFSLGKGSFFTSDILSEGPGLSWTLRHWSVGPGILFRTSPTLCFTLSFLLCGTFKTPVTPPFLNQSEQLGLPPSCLHLSSTSCLFLYILVLPFFSLFNAFK